MNDHYQLVTLKSVPEDCMDIVTVLQKIKDGLLANDLRLLNYYNEIPVSYPAAVDYIEDDMVDLSVHQHQAAVMKVERKSILKSRHLPHEVLANVFRANANSSLVTLTNFAYVVVRAERRRFVRVAIKDAVGMVFTRGEQELRGRLVDISLCGAAMVASDGGALDTQSEGDLLLELPGRAIRVQARLVKIFSTKENSKYVFEFDVPAKDEPLVSQYIFQRQVEIIRELKDQLC